MLTDRGNAVHPELESLLALQKDDAEIRELERKRAALEPRWATTSGPAGGHVH